MCLGTVSGQNLVWIHDHMWVKNLFDLMHGLDGSWTFGKMHIISFLESHPYKQKSVVNKGQLIAKGPRMTKIKKFLV